MSVLGSFVYEWKTKHHRQITGKRINNPRPEGTGLHWKSRASVKIMKSFLAGVGQYILANKGRPYEKFT